MTRPYARLFEETCCKGSTIEIRECLSCFGDYFERSRDAPPYYPHHDAVNGIDCALYTILFDAAIPDPRDHNNEPSIVTNNASISPETRIIKPASGPTP